MAKIWTARSLRALVAPMLALSVSAAVTPTVASAGPLARPAIKVVALKFARSTIDATTGTAKVALTWTIADTAAKASNITGSLTLGVPGKKPGTFLSASFTVNFDLHSKTPVSASGTARRSTYRYTFRVPKYAQTSAAAWQVTALGIGDNRSNHLSVSSATLRAFHAVLTAKELTDTQPPTANSLSTSSLPYLFVGNGMPASINYQFFAADDLSGVAGGAIELSGPGGRSMTTTFSCGPTSSACDGPFTSITANVVVTFPPGSAAGPWVVAELRVSDAAGNTATFGNLGANPVLVTSDQNFTATGFSASPNPVNDWTQGRDVTTELSMRVHGAGGGITGVFVTTTATGGGNCTQAATTPTVTGTKVSVPIRIEALMAVCQVTGIAVVDGAGNVALYGPDYQAPDPFLLIKQVADTTPPKATAASVSPTTLSSTQSDQDLTLTVTIAPRMIPITGIDVCLLDQSGGSVACQLDNVSVTSGQATADLSLLSPPAAGTYHVGFVLSDVGQLSTAYGTGVHPVPGGPLIVTVS